MSKKQIALIILGIVVMAVIWKLDEPNRKAQNKYMCAVYGYYEDCTTPLKEEDKLK